MTNLIDQLVEAADGLAAGLDFTLSTLEADLTIGKDGQRAGREMLRSWRVVRGQIEAAKEDA